MDNERTTPEGDTDDMLRELDQLQQQKKAETVRGELDETSTHTKDGAIPSSYGAPGGTIDGGDG